MLNSESIRKDFPILSETTRNKPLVYLDTAASAQKPQAVIDAISDCYSRNYANIHRGVYELSARATNLYEEAREKARAFLGAAGAQEIIFVRGATEAINLVAWSFGRTRTSAGDEVVVSALEHHSNLVPWQQLCEEQGAKLRVAPIDEAGEFDLAAFEALLGERTRMVAVTHVSNATGAGVPVREVTRLAAERGIPVLVDGAQAAPRFPVDVQELGCDFYACSGHKLYGPSGIGVLYGRAELLRGMPPYQAGGGMIREVSFDKTQFADPPERFEAGTPHIVGAIGLGAALDYLENIGMENVARHEAELLAYGVRLLEDIPGLEIISAGAKKTGVMSFVIDGIHPHDIGTILDGEGVAVRAGHHCAQPLMDLLKVPATTRASLGIYNTREDLDRLAEAVRRCVEMFR